MLAADLCVLSEKDTIRKYGVQTGNIQQHGRAAYQTYDHNNLVKMTKEFKVERQGRRSKYTSAAEQAVIGNEMVSCEVRRLNELGLL